MGHSTPNRTVRKILIFDFLQFLTFFSKYLTMKKLFLVNFENFWITGLKDIEFRFFADNFLQ